MWTSSVEWDLAVSLAGHCASVNIINKVGSSIVHTVHSLDILYNKFWQLLAYAANALIPWCPQTITATMYTMTATATKTWKTNGVLLRNRQIHDIVAQISPSYVFGRGCHGCGRHGLWPSLSNPLQICYQLLNECIILKIAPLLLIQHNNIQGTLMVRLQC